MKKLRQNLFRHTSIKSRRLSGKVTEVKDKIVRWLSEETLSIEDMNDPNNQWNISVNTEPLFVNIIQCKDRSDSIMLCTNYDLSEQQMEQLNTIGEEKIRQFWYDVRLTFSKNNELGTHKLHSKIANNITGVFICSRRIYYDGLTKDRLMFLLGVIQKTIFSMLVMLDRATGVHPTKNLEFYR